MASSMTDFLQTFLNLKQVQNQTEQIAQRAKTDAISGMTTFMELAKHTADPGARQALVQRFADLGVASSDQLTSIQYHVAPTQEAQKDQQTQLGIANNTPEDAARLAQETANATMAGQNAGQLSSSAFLKSVYTRVGDIAKNHQDFMDKLAVGLGTRTAAGQDAGAFMASAARAALPAPELTQGAGVANETRMSAAQAANNTIAQGGLKLGAAQLTETARANTMDAIYKKGMLAVDQAKVDLMGGKGQNAEMISRLLDNKSGILKSIAASKDLKGSVAVGFLGALNGVNAQLEAAGQPTEGQYDYNPQELLGTGVFSRNTQRGPTNAVSRRAGQPQKQSGPVTNPYLSGGDPSGSTP